MKPTTNEINLAQRLQKAGLCQGAEKWVAKLTKSMHPEDKIGTCIITDKPEDVDKDGIFYTAQGFFQFELIGSIPTFEMVMKELVPLLREHNCSLIMMDCMSDLINNDDMNKCVSDPNGIGYFYDECGGFIGSATEALLCLHGEKG